MQHTLADALAALTVTQGRLVGQKPMRVTHDQDLLEHGRCAAIATRRMSMVYDAVLVCGEKARRYACSEGGPRGFISWHKNRLVGAL